MKKTFLGTLFSFILFTYVTADNLSFYVAKGGNNSSISYDTYNLENPGEIDEFPAVDGLSNSTYLLVTPQSVYATDEESPGAVTEFTKNDTTLEVKNKLSLSNANGSVFISKLENDLFIANYGMFGSGSGINIVETKNNEMKNIEDENYSQFSVDSHAHSVYAISINEKKYVYAADLGTDKIHVYAFDGSKFNEIQVLSMQQGSGPRSMAIDTVNNKIYVANENDSTISILSINPEDGELSFEESVKSYKGDLTVPTNFPSGIMLADDNKRLYVANRGLDVITLFDINDDGSIYAVEDFLTGYKWPRDFDIDKDGDHLVVANQDSSNPLHKGVGSGSGVSLFNINKENGYLNLIAKKGGEGIASVKFDS